VRRSFPILPHMHHDRVQLESFPTAEAMASAMAQRWVRRLADRPSPPHRVALSGGRIAAVFQREAARFATELKVDWTGVEFFWGDERCVPPDHADSNFRVANEALLTPCGISSHRIHRLRGELPPTEASELGIHELRQSCPGNAEGWPVLDLVLLGMGEDGHVASLFPNTPSETSHSRQWVVPVIGPKPPPQRLSLTFGVLAAAREVWVLASGADKASALSASLQFDGVTPLAQLIQMRSQTHIAGEIAIFANR